MSQQDATPCCYVVQRFNHTTATAEDQQQIQRVYDVAFSTDIKECFDPSHDKDFKEPLTYYVSEVGGTYYVIKRMEWVVGGDGGKKRLKSTIVGTCGIRRLPSLPHTCELKRMFALPECRGKGLGAIMLDALLDELYSTLGPREGYRCCVLDTKRRLAAANRLYEKTGFVDCENYNGSDRPDRWMRLDLSQPRRFALNRGPVSKL